MRRLVVAAASPPLRAALLDEGRLQGYWRLGAGPDSLVGERFFGRVTAIDRGLESAFVAIGLARDGFLPLAECQSPLQEGAVVTVEVARDPVDGKGARLTARLGEAVRIPPGTKPPSRLTAEKPLHRLVRRLGGDLAILADTRRGAAELSVLATSLPAARHVSVQHLPERDWPLRLVDIETEAAAALEARCELSTGAWLLFEPCQALTVVDVNSGTAQGNAGERLWLRTNLAAAKEIARQLRLRHIGGIVVIDFVDLKSPSDRQRVGEALREATSRDWEPCWVGRMSRLGLVEMTRRRSGPTLAEMWCLGTGKA